MMLLKCCTQYVGKFGKLSGDHRIGKGEFSFQSQRWAMPNNVQITTKLNSFHVLERWCSKSFNMGFNSTWTKNLQMHKLDLEKTEEQDIKLPMHIESQKSQENSRKKIYFCSIDYTKAFDCVDQNKMWKILQEMGIPDHLICFLRNLYIGQEATVRTGQGTQSGWKLGTEYIKAVYCHPAYLTYM